MMNFKKLFVIPLVGAFALTLTPASAQNPTDVLDNNISPKMYVSQSVNSKDATPKLPKSLQVTTHHLIEEFTPSPLSDPADQFKRELKRIDEVAAEEARIRYEAAQEEARLAIIAEEARLKAIETARLEAEAAAKAEAEKVAAEQAAAKAAADKVAADQAVAEEARVQKEIEEAAAKTSANNNTRSSQSNTSRSNNRTDVASAPAVAAPAANSGSSAMRCEVPSGNSMLQPWVSKVRTRINAQFGEHTIGGTRPGDPQDHGKGLALDVMTSGVADGDAIAQWARANAGQLNITYVIWQQKIWSVQRSGEGWRPMSDRGSVSANHYDHVHLSFNYGDGSCPA